MSSSVLRAQLQKEKQLREDAEEQRRDLENRLKNYEDEVEKARKGMSRGRRLAAGLGPASG